MRRSALCAALLAALLLSAAPATAGALDFLPGVEGFDVFVAAEGGVAPEGSAGAHPHSITTDIDFEIDEETEGQPGGPFTAGDLRNLDLELPPGLIENPRAVSRCSQARFHTARVSPFETSRSGEYCPALSQVGIVEVRSSAEGGGTRTFGVFNLVPPPGFPSQIGFSPFGIPIVLTPQIRDLGGEYGLTLRLRNLSQRINIRGLKLTIWGNPWAISHNGQRGNCLNQVEPTFPFAKCPISPPQPDHVPRAYLTLPTSCGGPLSFAAKASSWQNPTSVVATTVGAPLGSCLGVPFAPQALAQVTNPRASSPTGLDFSLTANEEDLLNPARIAPSQVRKAVVALPEGMTLNPSLAAGLGSCSAASYAAETVSSSPGSGCPNNSKIGGFTVQSPLFEDAVDGAIFLAEPDDRATSAPGAENPFDSLLALYLVAKAPDRGILVKVAGELQADPGSGRLTARFDRLPQLPYSNLKLHFKEGQRAPLVAPSACGDFAIQIGLSPWLDPNATASSSSRFQISKGIGAGEACPNGTTPPFRPRAEGGAPNKNAGAYTPFHLLLSRADSEQEITSYSATLPPGLLGSTAGVPYCPDAAIEGAKQRTGREEERHPSCPAASEIGRTLSGYGASSVLAYAPGKLYLAGPYRGSTFSIVAINSATVGPFDLGVVVVRSAIRVDRRSARVTVDSTGSDPIPHILQGVPIHLRDVRVYIDKPHTTVNPTSCEPFSVVSTLTGSGADVSNPGDDVQAIVPNHFQVSNCGSLGFKPGLRISLRGGVKRGRYPSLRAVYRAWPGDANISRAAVTLPRSLFLAQDHIETVCTRPQSERDACPPGSIYGRAKVLTPLLSKPLEGPVYLRSSENTLPDLVAALRGNGVAIDLLGRIDSDRGGIRASFDALPDAPVSVFEMTLKGGKRGILVNAANTCAGVQRANARFLGQNNRGEALKPRLRPRCPKPAKQKRRPGRGRGAR